MTPAALPELTSIRVAGAAAEAIVAGPPEGSSVGSVPGVILFMDAFGLRSQIRSMAERIASWGYVVLAPNVFHRTMYVAELADRIEELRDPVSGAIDFAGLRPHLDALTTDLAVADIGDYLAALRDLPGVATGAVGVTGYCMGARLAVHAANAYPAHVAACGAFHGGRLATDAADSPHLGLAATRARFVFGHADDDPSMPATAVARLGEALAAAGLDARNEVYPGARHGFTMADTPAFDADAAERHYVELRELLDRTLR